MASDSHTVTTTRLAVPTTPGSLAPVHWTALGLAAATGLVHVYLYTTEDWLPFLLAGAGFLGAIGLFFAMKRYRRLLYAGGIAFTAAQIAGYLLFPMGPVWLGVLDKAVQAALILSLGYLFVRDGRAAGA